MNDPDLKLLSELTLVMTTFNRPLELERAIEYWRDTPVTIHILDGSADASLNEGLLPDTNSIFYHHKPSYRTDLPLVDFFERMVMGSNLSLTKYSAICPEDDFFTISGLIESIIYLENNNEIDAVSGSILHYQKKRNSIFWNFHHRVRLNYNLLETPSLETRVENESTTWFLYAVCRTPIWKQFIQVSYERREFTEPQFYANEFIMFKLSKGMFRTKSLNTLTLIRQHTLTGWNVAPKITWKDWLLDKSNNFLIDEIADQLAKGFNAVSSSSDAEKNLQIAKKLMVREQEKVLSQVDRIPNLRERVRYIFIKIIFKVFPNLKVFSDRPHKLKDSWEMLDATGLSYNRRELQYINDLLLKPREELRLKANI